jgi:hypothetical protein
MKKQNGTLVRNESGKNEEIKIDVCIYQGKKKRV